MVETERFVVTVDIIHRIHLRSVFLISRAAWPHMKQQNYGRSFEHNSIRRKLSVFRSQKLTQTFI